MNYLYLGPRVVIRTLVPISLIWIVYMLQMSGSITTLEYSINKSNGLTSIITGTFMHGSISHIVGNTTSLLLTIPILSALYKNSASEIMIAGIIIPSAVGYLGDFNIVGISGLCYTIIWFIIIAGMKSTSIIKWIFSILMVMWGGSSIKGATHFIGPGIAWTVHLTGLILGIYYGLTNREN